ncbi:MAG TPA: prepilin peptidase [Solirubrobacteraceae bacterium]|nr:prepilin peptidase [Solirubrobacteraceae bacterium]
MQALKEPPAAVDESFMETAFAGVFGAIFGSFLNVVTHRLPRRESLVAPASHCVACGVAIKPYDNIPVLSWLLLRGRCRSCGVHISARYPLIEAGTAALCVAVVLVKGSAAGIALGLAMVLLLVPAAAIDLEHRRIPNVITLSGAVLAIALGLAFDPSGEPIRLLAGLGAGGAFLIVTMISPQGMGMGDVKLAAMLGLFLGKAVIPAILIALLAGVLVGGVVIVRLGVGQGRKTAVPFGPFLALGAVVALFAGQPILHWYSTSVVH